MRPVMEAPVFRDLLRAGRNCHWKSSVEFSFRARAPPEKIRFATPRGIRISRGEEAGLKCGADARPLVRGNVTKSRNGWNIDADRGYIYLVPGLPGALFFLFSFFFYDFVRSPEFFMATAFTYRYIPWVLGWIWDEITLARAPKFRVPQAITIAKRGFAIWFLLKVVSVSELALCASRIVITKSIISTNMWIKFAH